MKKLSAVTAIMFFLSPHPSLGRVVAGAGNDSCGTWTKERKAGFTVSQHWVLGYLSAINLTVDPNVIVDLFQGFQNTDALWAWLDNYCAKNPLDDVATASQKLVIEMIKRKR